MTQPSQDDILCALSSVKVPGTDGNLVSEGMISSLTAKEHASGISVQFVIEIDPTQVTEMEDVRRKALSAVHAIGGITAASAVLSAHRAEPAAVRGTSKKLPPGVKRVIAVASGKGGVGKSTVAANMSVALAGCGLKTGLLDIDVYGPSVPRLMGVSDHKIEQPQDGDAKMRPVLAHGVSLMSIGFLVDEATPMIWRGPIVHGAIRQMLFEVAWEGIDVLVLDMPPGTGDAALSVAQGVPLAGAVIVSTPQDLALLDVRKSIAMFRKVGVPIIGLIENMARFECPYCGKSTDIFGHGGAKKDAERFGIPFLGEIPLTMDLRLSADVGQPIVKRAPETAPAKAIADIVMHVMREIL